MFVFAPLHDAHIVTAFDCGIESLNHYLKNVARQHQARNLSRVFVVTEEGSLDVLGYYALSNCTVDASALPKPKKFKLPSSMAIPAILIGKLARDLTVRGTGLGALLLFDALKRCVEVNERSAAYAIVLDAINDQAKAFYLQYEFQVLTGNDPYRLFLPMQHVIATLTLPKTG